MSNGLAGNGQTGLPTNGGVLKRSVSMLLKQVQQGSMSMSEAVQTTVEDMLSRYNTPSCHDETSGGHTSEASSGSPAGLAEIRRTLTSSMMKSSRNLFRTDLGLDEEDEVNNTEETFNRVVSSLIGGVKDTLLSELDDTELHDAKRQFVISRLSDVVNLLSEQMLPQAGGGAGPAPKFTPQVNAEAVARIPAYNGPVESPQPLDVIKFYFPTPQACGYAGKEGLTNDNYMNHPHYMDLMLWGWFKTNDVMDAKCKPFAPFIRVLAERWRKAEKEGGDAAVKRLADAGDAWLADTKECLVGRLILFDQLSRNCFRKTVEPFTYTDLVGKVVKKMCILAGGIGNLPRRRIGGAVITAAGERSKYPLYGALSFMECFFVGIALAHSESLEEHEKYETELHKEMDKQFPEFANFLAWNAKNIVKTHVDLLRRFGRYPHRNNALGRPTLPNEQAHLENREALQPFEKSQYRRSRPRERSRSRSRETDGAAGQKRERPEAGVAGDGDAANRRLRARLAAKDRRIQQLEADLEIARDEQADFERGHFDDDSD